MALNDPDEASAAVAGTGVVTACAHPHVVPRAVTDPGVLDQGRVFAEAVNQTRPIATCDSEVRHISNVIQKGTGQSRGISQVSADRMATKARTLDSFTQGPNPRGLAAEVVAVSDYRVLHAGANPGIVNAPDHVSPHVRDIRVAPDCSSRKDLILAIDMKGRIVWKYNGQVKTGGSQYVADSLVKMANTPGYGKTGYVDSRYVNMDGTPRVAPDAFTPAQARRLQEARVRLRGLPDLEARAEQLIGNIRAFRVDGLNPVARNELKLLRNDIAAAYGARSVSVRVGGGAVASAASAALVSLVVQLVTDGEIDARSVGKSAGVAAIIGAVGVAADAGLYHVGRRGLEMTPEVAKEFAKQKVAIGSCVISVGTDVASEIRAARRGDVSMVGATGGAAAKTALDLLPLVMAPLGLIGIPVLAGAQIGGRLLVEKGREADRVLGSANATDDARANDIKARMVTFTGGIEDAFADNSDTDDIFHRVMGDSHWPRTTLAAVGAGQVLGNRRVI